MMPSRAAPVRLVQLAQSRRLDREHRHTGQWLSYVANCIVLPSARMCGLIVMRPELAAIRDLQIVNDTFHSDLRT